MFALEAHVLGTFHHVFALDTLSGGYLGHVSDAPGSLCLVAVFYLDICDSSLPFGSGPVRTVYLPVMAMVQGVSQCISHGQLHQSVVVSHVR